MAPVADLVCFSHLRWDGVTQRPQHLAREAARTRRVFVVEEPELVDEAPRLHVRTIRGIVVATPMLPEGIPSAPRRALLRSMVDDLLSRHEVRRPWLWFWTPILHPWTVGIDAAAVVYDRMDDLSAFRGAPTTLVEREDRLLAEADVVFTGGQSLYETTRRRHPRVFAVPSSVDTAHFRRARLPLPEPADQAGIPRPRIGWFGVIDERFDGDLVRAVARMHPTWQFVLVGPVAKIDRDELPRERNVHLLGSRQYDELPAYLGGWDVAIMPFAGNDATRTISPTKTPEYLAGGRPVVSTAIRDVVVPYAEAGLVRIADDPGSFAAAIGDALRDDRDALARRADRFLDGRSWSATWPTMDERVRQAIAERRDPTPRWSGAGLPAGRAAAP